MGTELQCAMAPLGTLCSIYNDKGIKNKAFLGRIGFIVIYYYV